MTRHLTSTATLFLLAVLSVGSFVLVEAEAASLAIGLAAAAIALAKATLILNRFMHLQWHHRPFAPVLAVWLALVAVILGTGLAVLPWDGHAGAIHDLPGDKTGIARRD